MPKEYMHMNTPTYLFALREDIKDLKEFLPTRATPEATGYDVSAAWEDHKEHTIYPGEFIKIPLGLRCHIPIGWWLELKPRSSTFTKKKLHSLIGTIDRDYTGQFFYCAQYLPKEITYSGNLEEFSLCIEFGEKIGQLIPIRLQEMNVGSIDNDEFDKIEAADKENTRKSNGFGSSDALKGGK